MDRSAARGEDGRYILEEEVIGSDSLSDAINVEDYDDGDASEDSGHRNLRGDRRLDVNCHACKITCEWYDFDCHGEKMACWSTGATMKVFLSSFEAICNKDPDRMKARALVNEAVQILVDKRLFSANELNSAKIRFCSALKLNTKLPTGYIVTDTNGMAPSRDKVLIHTSYIHKSAKELAVLLAHELPIFVSMQGGALINLTVSIRRKFQLARELERKIGSKRKHMISMKKGREHYL